MRKSLALDWMGLVLDWWSVFVGGIDAVMPEPISAQITSWVESGGSPTRLLPPTTRLLEVTY
jgi:hypothetical protein